MRSLEIDSYGFESRLFDEPGDYRRNLSDEQVERIETKLRVPNWERLWFLADAIRAGFTVERIYELSGIDPWFINNIRLIVEMEGRLIRATELLEQPEGEVFSGLLREAKQMGFSDKRLALLWDTDEQRIRDLRYKLAILPGLQEGRHLWRRIRSLYALSLLDIRGRV